MSVKVRSEKDHLWLLWGLIPLAAWLTLSPPPPLARWSVQQVGSPCQATAPIGMTGKRAVVADATGTFVLITNAVISQTVCSAGVLTFTARGAPAENLFPLMSVSFGGQTLLTTRPVDPKMYRVRVPGPGVLTLVFHNDRYRPERQPPEDRNLFVSQWVFRPVVPRP